MNTTLTNTERPPKSYNQDYLKYRHSILHYRSQNKEIIATYMRRYMKKYRKRPGVAETWADQACIRKYLRGLPNRTSFKAIQMIGCTRNELAQKLGFPSEPQFEKTVRESEIDHIISRKWLTDSFPALLPFLNRHYNLQIVSEKINRTKGKYTNGTDPKVQEILRLMWQEHAISSVGDN